MRIKAMLSQFKEDQIEWRMQKVFCILKNYKNRQ